jgi:Zn-dependent M16 (insulinase) family peptidase
MSPVAALNHRLSGLAGIRDSKRLDDSLRDKETLAAFARNLARLHDAARAMPLQFLIIAEAEHLDEIRRATEQVWSGFPAASGPESWQPVPVREPRREAWVTNTQVNFCAKAFPTVPGGHADAPALTVLGGFLRNGYLHTAIREKGGAYGGGASQDSSIGAFRFFSYRDPRLEHTLTDFDASVRWVLEKEHGYEPLEQAILGVVSSLDRPSSPAGEAKQDFHNRLFGRTHEQREEFRRRVLAVTVDDLKRVAETYLNPAQASIAVITSQSGLESAKSCVEELELEVEEL